MKKRFRKIGIAARLTAVVAVILAVFVVPWVVNTAKQARFDAQDSANSDVNNRFRGIDYRLTEKGYDPDNMPSVNTPEYDAMRFDVAYYNWRLEQPYLMQYYDGQNKQVVMRSPL